MERVPVSAMPPISNDIPWESYSHQPAELPAQLPDTARSEEELKQLYREVCPLLDRVGRAMSDLSSQLWNHVEPGSLRSSQTNRPIDPAGSLESRLLSLLRER